MDVEDPRSKGWSQRGTIVAVGKHRDYYVKLPCGHVYCRNRVFLHPYLPPKPIQVGVSPQRLQQQEDQVFQTESCNQMDVSEDTDENSGRTKDVVGKQTVVNDPLPLPDLRRSQRQRRPVQRFDITTTTGKSYI